MTKVRKWNVTHYHRAKAERPWVIFLSWARSRCTSKNHPYHKKGIKVRLSVDEAKQLWERDRAAYLVKPSLDRIDPAGDYTFENCRFIELSTNRDEGRRGRWYRDDAVEPLFDAA